jgi:hypothetical protein
VQLALEVARPELYGLEFLDSDLFAGVVHPREIHERIIAGACSILVFWAKRMTKWNGPKQGADDELRPHPEG